MRRSIVYSKEKEKDLGGKIREGDPSLILTLGKDALIEAIRYAGEIPVVYTYVTYPWKVLPEKKTNIMGVPLLVPPEVTLTEFLKVAPTAKSVGLVYDPEESGRHVDEIRIAAGKLGMEAVALKLKIRKEVPGLLKSLVEKIDVFWMQPDLTAFSPPMISLLIRFYKEKGIPVITFSDHFVHKGSLMAVNMNDFEMGLQAGKMAKKRLAGIPIKEIPQLSSRKTVISFNKRTAQTVDLKPTEAMQAKEGKIVYLPGNL